MILVDTGPLGAAALSGDVNHVRCTELFTALHMNSEALLIPALVVTGVCYLLEREAGPRAEVSFLELTSEGDFTVVDLEPGDYPRHGRARPEVRPISRSGRWTPA